MSSPPAPASALPAPSPAPAAAAPLLPPVQSAGQPGAQQSAKPSPAYGGSAAPATHRGPTIVDLAPGTLFAGKYRIEKQLGKGGMGAVYLANQELLNRRVAIKLLHLSADATTAARFQREARVIAQCQHPNIVNLIDFGEDDGRLFLVMEYIDGHSLTQLLQKEAPFPPKRACDIGIQIAEALATAHDINIIHRDLKPDNIMVVSTPGRRDYVKILDFGVAKIKRDPNEGQVNTVETKAGLIVGSLRYISPEQVESGEITTRTDMYAFGAVLYEMLAGRRVFDYPSPADCAIAHLTEPPKPPTANGRVLEGPLVDFVMQCLEKKAERRPINGRIAAQVLSGCREMPVKQLETPKQGLLADDALTMALPESAAYAAMQASKTAAVPLPPLRQSDSHPRPSEPPASSRLPTVTSHDAHGSPRPSTGHANPPTPARSAMPDVQLRPRPAGADGFAIVGGGEVAHTATHLDGVRLLPRHPVQPIRQKSYAWLWATLGLLVIGGLTTLFILSPWSSGPKPTPGTTPTPTREASAPAADATSGATSDDTASTLGATVASADTATAPSDDAAPANSDAATDDAAPSSTRPLTLPATEDAVVTAEKLEGVEITSVPEEATVTLAGKPVGKTPYTVNWGPDEPPPIVRISRKGYVDVDLQLVRSDRGTRRNVPLRPLDLSP